MYLEKVWIQNFRLLQDTTLYLQENLSLIIGRNNSGKTSFLTLFEKFYKDNRKFKFNDYPIALRNKLYEFNKDSDVNDLAIRLTLKIKCTDNDNLDKISEFIVDLDPTQEYVKILFECRIDKDKLLKKLKDLSASDKKKYIEKNLSDSLIKHIYAYEHEDDFKSENRHKLAKKELSLFKEIVNLEIIHANRSLSSSESTDPKQVLSGLTTDYYNSEKEFDVSKAKELNESMSKVDESFDKVFPKFFEDFLKQAKDFLKIADLKVISNIQENEVMKNSTKVIYGTNENHLPEHLNGLGYMNIIFLLLTIEIKKKKFENEGKDLNLLFIEEPEAHTHPQMQYIFAAKVQDLFKSKKLAIQGLITTHSSHIVSKSDFNDIRYMKKTLFRNAEGIETDNIEIKNFCKELEEQYTDKEEFKFLTKYLTLQASELFFASKIIFIEGSTERILLPYFISQIDNSPELNEEDKLSSQNISVLEVGANAKAFDAFLKFFDIKTLIITDIDTTKLNDKSNRYKAIAVSEGSRTSNETLKHFFKAPDANSTEWDVWFNKLKQHSIETNNINLKIAYQKEENGYHARSFEDAFLKVNLAILKANKDNLEGLQNTDRLESFDEDSNKFYELTNNILDAKADFATSLLYNALSKDIIYTIPLYIEEGLKWLAKD